MNIFKSKYRGFSFWVVMWIEKGELFVFSDQYLAVALDRALKAKFGL